MYTGKSRIRLALIFKSRLQAKMITMYMKSLFYEFEVVCGEVLMIGVLFDRYSSTILLFCFSEIKYKVPIRKRNSLFQFYCCIETHLNKRPRIPEFLGASREFQIDYSSGKEQSLGSFMSSPEECKRSVLLTVKAYTQSNKAKCTLPLSDV